MKITLSFIITLQFGKEVISICSIVIFLEKKIVTLTHAEAKRHTQIR